MQRPFPKHSAAGNNPGRKCQRHAAGHHRIFRRWLQNLLPHCSGASAVQQRFRHASDVLLSAPAASGGASVEPQQLGAHAAVVVQGADELCARDVLPVVVGVHELLLLTDPANAAVLVWDPSAPLDPMSNPQSFAVPWATYPVSFAVRKGIVYCTLPSRSGWRTATGCRFTDSQTTKPRARWSESKHTGGGNTSHSQTCPRNVASFPPFLSLLSSLSYTVGRGNFEIGEHANYH